MGSIADPNTRVVIVGAGVVGAALADELTQRGLTSVTVVDQGPLYRTGGSSSHAPGFAFQTTGSEVMSELARRTLDKLDGLEVDGEWVIKRVGGVELACDAERLQYLHRRHNLAESWGVPSRIVTPEECAELFPGLDASVILGGLHTPTDAVIKCVRAIEWQARRAIDHGAVFYGHTQVTDFDIRDGRIRGVYVRPTPPVPGNPSKGSVLPEGTDHIAADVVVLCCGLWGPGLAALVGIELPMVPMEHCSAFTTTLPSRAGFPHDVEVEGPMVRHQATGSYFRQYGDSLVWGSYEHRVMPLEQSDIATPEQFAESGIEPATHPLTWDDLSDAWSVMHRLVPETRQTEASRGYNGIFSFTPDGNPLLGEVPEIEGLWLGESVWLTQAAGVAQLLADWLVTGDPGLDTTSLDFRRFDQRHLTRTASIARASENYDDIYDIAHPRTQTRALRRFSTSPFYLRQAERGAVFGQRNGWERPLWYSSSTVEPSARDAWSSHAWSPAITAEARSALTTAGLADLGPVAVFSVKGSHASAYMTRVTGVDDMPRDHAFAAVIESPAGGIAAELTVIRTGRDEFAVVGSDARDEWTLRRDAGPDVSIIDVSSGTSALVLVGPASRAVLSALVRGDVPATGGDASPHVDLGGVPVRLVPERASGATGWTLYFAVEHGLFLWDLLLASREQLTPIGADAYSALRIANGTPAFGVDYGPQVIPAEAGLTTPREPRSARAGHRLLVQLMLRRADQAVVTAEPVLFEGSVAGYITSSAEDPRTRRVLAFAWVDERAAAKGTPVQIGYLDRLYDADVILTAHQEEPAAVYASRS